MTDAPQVLTRKHLFAAAFFAILIYLVYQAGRIIAPFFSALLWSAIIVLILHPFSRRLLRAFRGRETAAAAAMTLLTLLIIIGPAVALLTLLASQGMDLYAWASDKVRSGDLAEAWSRFRESPIGRMLTQFPLGSPGLKASVLNSLGDLSADMASQIGSLLRNTLVMVVNLLIMVLSLFFFYRDGASYLQHALVLLPFTEQQKKVISQRLFDTFRAVINGVFLIALLQGFMTGIGFAVFRIPFPALWGSAAAVLALLPIGGAAIIWLGGAAYLYLTGQTLGAVLLVVWGVVLVTLPDNFLRPLIIGKKAKLPTFLLFLGILGGIQAYGMLGILFGPLVVTLLMALVAIYREEFAEKH